MIVIDDLLEVPSMDAIENYFSNDVDWRLSDFATGPDYNGFNHSQAEDTSQFVHLVYHERMGGVLNQLSMRYMLNVLQKIEKKFDIKIENYYRLKANTTLKRPDFVDKHNPSHTDLDWEDDWIVCIYYINDSDGDTYFFDNDGNTIKRVTPKKGRCVIFDSKIHHAGTCPINNNYRLVANLIVKPNSTDFLL